MLISQPDKIFISSANVDMRKSIDGLSSIVEQCFHLSRQTMANWLIKGANLLKPLYEDLQKQLVANKFIHADETTLEVLHEKDRAPTARSYMWVYRTGRHKDRQIALYKYEVGRSGDFSKKFLQGFSGYLHCDGWSGYGKVENAERCGCWAHLRRYFKNALDVQENKIDYSTIAGQAFLRIEKIFALEKTKEKDKKIFDS